MNLTETATLITEVVVQTKRLRCEMFGGPTDLLPMVVVVMEQTSEHRVATLPDVESTAITAVLLARAERVAVVAFLADVYTQAAPVDAPMPSPGDLTASFHSGDLAVTEALSIHAIDVRTRSATCIICRYRYGDDGMPTFDAFETMKLVVGATPTALRAAVEAVRR